MRILIIEDQKSIVETIQLALQIRWPEVEVAHAGLGERGIEMVEREKPDIVILDLGLPDMSGFEVLKEIRSFSDVPVLILTVRRDEADIVKGLKWGADDYMVKPFKQLELLSRLKALIRRQPSMREEQIEVGGELKFDPATQRLFHGDREIPLTKTEGQIVHELMLNAGDVVTYSKLADAVWDADYEGAAEALKVHIRRLRLKLESDPDHPSLILNRPGMGYLLAKPEQP